MKSLFSFILLSVCAFSISAQSSVQKAQAQFDMRDYRLAISSFEQAYADDADNMEIPASIAECYVQLQDYLKASQWYEKIVDKEDVTPEVLIAYGDVLKSLRLYAKAKFYYQMLGQYDEELARYYVESCDIARIEMQGTPYYDINTLSINSRSSDFGPFLLNKDLIYSSLRDDMPVEAVRKSRNNKIALSETNTLYVAPKYGTKEIEHYKNLNQSDEVISNIKFSEDGKWVAYTKSDFREGQRLFDNRPGKLSLFIGKVSSGGDWSDVKPFEHNINGASTGYPSFSPDGSVLYFASTRAGGYGGWDLYISFRGIDGWTAPQNMGAVVNTPGNEISPFYSDHKLYFSSDRHPGVGGFDIFKATSSEGQWTNVRSMGYPLNSPKDDIDFIWDPIQKTGYFASNRVGTTGAYDIYSCTPLYEEIMMTVMDHDGNNVIEGAMLKYRGGTASPIYTDATGTAVIHQRFNEASSLTIIHDGYKNLDMTLKAPGEGPAQYEVFIDKSLESDADKDSEVVAVNPVSKNSEKSNSNTQTPKTATNSSQITPAESQEAIVSTKVVTVGSPSNGPATTTEQKQTSATAQEVTATSISQQEKDSTPEKKEDFNYQVPVNNSGMYAVQIAAVAKSTSLDSYSSLSSIGKVMQYPENGMYKIRVGYYNSSEQAKNALKSIKQSGYPDAFVVKANPVADDAKIYEDANREYMVRLGTYSKPEYFDESKVQHLGKVSSRMSGKFTIMLLTGYDSYETADKARKGAIPQGFKDAYIVYDDNGSLKKAKR